jgi:hypothetical protein
MAGDVGPGEFGCQCVELRDDLLTRVALAEVLVHPVDVTP